MAARGVRHLLAALLLCPRCAHGLPVVGEVMSSFQQLAICVVIVALLALSWYMRRRILFLLTGDDKLHCSPETTLFRCCCLCCNTCTGDWTRCLTNFTCVPHRYRNRNLVQMFGQSIGLRTYPVHLSHIIVGNLPCDARGDFYLDVENDLNPAMVTSVAEGANPRIVKFPEVFTIRVRRQLLRSWVTISVKDLNIVGSEKLCSLSVSHAKLLEWAAEGGTRRLEMKVATYDEFESPPWIMFEVAFPEEIADADELVAENHVLISDDSIQGQPSTTHIDNPNGTVSLTHSRSFFMREASLSEVKALYPLKNASGHRVDEPDEEVLFQFHKERRRIDACLCLLVTVVLSTVLVYWCFRSFAMACHNQMKLMLVQQTIDNGTVELSNAVTARMARFDYIEKLCAKNETQGLDRLGDKCNPYMSSVKKFCRQIPMQNRPCAYEHAIWKHTGTPVALPFFRCFRCTEVQWDMYDRSAELITIALLVGLVVCHQLAHCYKQHEIALWREEHNGKKLDVLSRLNRSSSSRRSVSQSGSATGSLRSNSRFNIFRTARPDTLGS
mmetsp:Transcript_50174/g.140053  ORF Transcript_50174/g.140053 Transcript_50174/m.140053 type:complete len:555 (-) Transcript_50174:494-2158(-)